MVDKDTLLDALNKTSGVKQAAADLLGTSEASIRRACRKYGVDAQQISLKRDISIPKISLISDSPDVSPTKDSVVIIPDLHSKYCNRKYLKVVCKFIKDFKPETVVQLGDIMDYECLMDKVKQKHPAFDADDHMALDCEYRAVADILYEVDSVTPSSAKRFILEGNHEFRSTLLIRRFPQLATIIGLSNRVNLGKWQVIPYLKPLKIGKLHFIHGEFYGKGHINKHLTHYQKNIAYGHTHDIAQDTLSSPMREIPIWGATFGCGCDLNPDYQRNKSSKWQHGFGYGWIRKNGDFDIVPKRVIHYSFSAEGKHYSL